MLERARLSSRHADRQRLAASGIPQSTSAWVRFLDNHARTFRQQWLAKGVGVPADGVKNDRSPCVRADTASRVHPPAALGGNITRHSIILVGSVLARAPKAERLATSICVPTVGQCVGTSASERRRFACYVTSNAMAKWHLQRSPFPRLLPLRLRKRKRSHQAPTLALTFPELPRGPHMPSPAHGILRDDSPPR
jgi:hypothetical protein